MFHRQWDLGYGQWDQVTLQMCLGELWSVLRSHSACVQWIVATGSVLKTWWSGIEKNIALTCSLRWSWDLKHGANSGHEFLKCYFALSSHLDIYDQLSHLPWPKDVQGLRDSQHKTGIVPDKWGWVSSFESSLRWLIQTFQIIKENSELQVLTENSQNARMCLWETE